MIKLNPLTRQYIDKYSDFIDENDFKSFYEALFKDLDANNTENFENIVGQITAVFYMAGLNPLNYMNFIPQFYLDGQSDEIIQDGKSILITVPKHIHLIKAYAFGDMDYAEIEYEGTKSEFLKIKKEQNWDDGTRLRIFCNDGEIPGKI